eukprot:scaffold328478_cov20-Prasinocladus_malaysianus.AAC.2
MTGKVGVRLLGLPAPRVCHVVQLGRPECVTGVHPCRGLRNVALPGPPGLPDHLVLEFLEVHRLHQLVGRFCPRPHGVLKRPAGMNPPITSKTITHQFILQTQCGTKVLPFSECCHSYKIRAQ